MTLSAKLLKVTHSRFITKILQSLLNKTIEKFLIYLSLPNKERTR